MQGLFHCTTYVHMLQLLLKWTNLFPENEAKKKKLLITYLTTDLASSRPSLVPLTRPHVAVLAVAVAGARCVPDHCRPPASVKQSF